jgi:hypothetical protein
LKLTRARTEEIGWPRKWLQEKPQSSDHALCLKHYRGKSPKRGKPTQCAERLRICLWRWAARSVYRLPRKAVRINQTGMKDSAIDRYRPNLQAR